MKTVFFKCVNLSFIRDFKTKFVSVEILLSVLWLIVAQGWKFRKLKEDYKKVFFFFYSLLHPIVKILTLCTKNWKKIISKISESIFLKLMCSLKTLLIFLKTKLKKIHKNHICKRTHCNHLILPVFISSQHLYMYENVFINRNLSHDRCRLIRFYRIQFLSF